MFVAVQVNIYAATKTISSGSWLVAGNWSPSGLPVNGDDIIITGAANLPFQNNDITLNNVTITIKFGGSLTLNKKCDLTLDANSTLIIESGGSISGTHGNSVAIIGTTGNLVGNGTYFGPRAANDQGWNVGSTSPLPVSLVDFVANLMDDHVKVEWTTASELNNDYFVVERKQEGEWEGIGEVHGNGTTNDVHFYQYDDYTIDMSKLAYYRLKQVDIDGKENISEVVDVDPIKLKGHTYSLLNIGNNVQIRFEDDHDEKTTVMVIASDGRNVETHDYNQISAGENLTLDLSGLSKGWYVVGIVGEDNAHFEKMIHVN